MEHFQKRFQRWSVVRLVGLSIHTRPRLASSLGSTIKTVLIASACYLAAAAFSLPASAKEAALTNKSVERMVQASLPESLIRLRRMR
ncbi:MAG: hypothetical protein ACYCTW_11995 [Sulfuricella sp.]